MEGYNLLDQIVGNWFHWKSNSRIKIRDTIIGNIDECSDVYAGVLANQSLQT